MQSERIDFDVLINNSPWKNAYWFARMLINGDKYASVGTQKENTILPLANQIETILLRKSLDDDEKLNISRECIYAYLKNSFREGTKGFYQVETLYQDLFEKFKTINDVYVFAITIKYILLPINEAMRSVPSNDRVFCYETATVILNTLGEKKVSKVINTWDDMGVIGCLNVERSLVVTEFTKLRTNLLSLNIPHTVFDDNLIMTAFVQEFERRLGQKRKSRAGTSLEDVTTFLFDYYKFTSHPKPDHFQTDIEVDKWFKCKDGWSIGISCKRTLRERWKQVSSADSHALSRYKIKEIWHIITYDKDLSDEKLTMLGQQRQIFYLADDSERFLSASKHVGMKEYVRPLSQLIEDIRREQKG